MSNAPQESQGPRKRRRRGNRNRNNNPNSQQRHDGPRQDGQRREGNRRQYGNGPRPAKAPVKLTLWQKLLKLVGIKPKAPAKPARPEREPRQEQTAPKSNTRVARTHEGQKTREPREPRERREPGPIESPRLYVGNLSYDVSESDLQDLFNGIGKVRSVEIVYNRNTHRSKGYGFVEMLNVDDAKRSVEVLHDQPFMGRKLNISSAKSKGQDEREDREERQPREERKPREAQPSAPAATEPTAETPSSDEENAA